MKNRSSFTIFTTIFSVLACFGLAFGNGGPESPDPTGRPVNSNTADGFRAVENSDNAFNSGFGWFSLFNNTDAFFNTGVGAGTLFFNDGPNNTAVGAAALFFNSTGGNENAVGVNALRDNDSGFFNNAHGTFALFSNVDGGQNNAFGDQALIDNVSGSFNTGIGDDALLSCTGNSNTALGDEAGSTLTGGEGNIYIGAQVQPGDPNEPEFIRIGNDTAFTFPYDTYIAGIFNRDVALATAVPVYVDDTGKLGTNLVNAAGNKVATPQAMLNESRNQQKRIAELEGTVARLAAMVKEQGAQIQKVSAQVEMSKPAPQVVVNKP
jgi:hypothetical protein